MKSSRAVGLSRIALLLLCACYGVTAGRANEPAPEPVTLEQALELAFARSPELAAFQAQVEEAEGGLMQAGVAAVVDRASMARTASAWSNEPGSSEAGKQSIARSTANRPPRFTRPSWQPTVR